MTQRPCFIMLADVSGYTSFVRLKQFSILHAEQIIADLLESVADATGVPLVLNEVLGDGLYFLAFEDDSPETAQRILAQTQATFSAFEHRKAELEGKRWCFCDGCTGISKLELKVILHHGPVAMTKVMGHEKPSGEAVDMAMGLLKNSVPSKRYLLLTEAFHLLSGAPDNMERENRSEVVAGVGDVDTVVYYPKHIEAPAAPQKYSVLDKLGQMLRIQSYSAQRVLLGKQALVKGMSRA